MSIPLSTEVPARPPLAAAFASRPHAPRSDVRPTSGPIPESWGRHPNDGTTGSVQGPAWPSTSAGLDRRHEDARDRMRLTASYLPLLLTVGLTPNALAQPAPPPTPTAPAPSPDYYTPGQTLGDQPSPSTQSPSPAPGTIPAPSPTPTLISPSPEPLPTQPRVAATASGALAVGSAAPSSATTVASVPPTDVASDDDAERRYNSLQIQNSYYGSTGLLRVAEAGSGASGTFRISFLSEWFTARGFLCTQEYPCANKYNDRSRHFGGTAALSITPARFLEAFVALRSYANSNTADPNQRLLQVLGDTTLGAKLFLPPARGRFFRPGFEAQLLFVNGSGSIGFDGSSTGARFRGLGTFDFTDLGRRSIPLRIHANAGYHIDNSAQAVSSTEATRNGPINRVERFGLGINRVDLVELGLGVEGAFSRVRPFISYTMDLPVNRQNYVCRPQGATTLQYNDGCLGNSQTMPTFPSRFTIGARAYPVYKGLAPMVAFDLGVTGTKRFVEELSPQPPWTLFVGIGYAGDVEANAPVTKHEVVEKIVTIAPPPQLAVRGTVHEQGKEDPIADAIVHINGMGGGGFVSGANGKFETFVLEPGTYTFTVKAEGYNEASCTATLAPPTQAPTPAPGPSVELAPQNTPVGPSPQDDRSTDRLPDRTPVVPPTQPAVAYIETSCALEALPKMGNIAGRITDAEKGTAIANARVTVVDATQKTLQATTNEAGVFQFQDVPPGDGTLRVEADKYLLQTMPIAVRPRETTQATIPLIARPKVSAVAVGKREIMIRKQVHFETNSAVILGDSNVLLAEIADAIASHPELRKIEIQGHTDNAGKPDNNQTLSDARANSVREWLVQHGIDSSRLESKGYGQTRPLVPNVTAGHRARNRRVQFVILERKEEPPRSSAPPTP